MHQNSLFRASNKARESTDNQSPQKESNMTDRVGGTRLNGPSSPRMTGSFRIDDKLTKHQIVQLQKAQEWDSFRVARGMFVRQTADRPEESTIGTADASPLRVKQARLD